MRKLLCALLVLALLAVPMLAISATAGSAVAESAILSDMLPDGTSDITAKDCDVKINKDGTMTIKITGAAPTVSIKLANGATLLTGSSVNVKDKAYVAVDFGTAGRVQFTHMILHYTRKDKAATGNFADLYLNSMAADDNYKEHRKQASNPGYVAGADLTNGGNYHVVWDWGTYVNKDGKVFDDGMHHFNDIEINLTGSAVGSELTFYTIAVVSDPNVKLGSVKPDPIDLNAATSSDDSSDETTSDETSDESSEASEDESSEVSDETSATSDETSETTSDASSAASSTETTSEASSVASSAATSSEKEDGGSNLGLIIGIVAAVVVVGAGAAVVIIRKKK